MFSVVCATSTMCSYVKLYYSKNRVMFQNWGFWEVVKACVQVTELLRVLFVLGQSSFLLCAF